MSVSVAVIGECMLELTHAQRSCDSVRPMNMSYGGDTINTSIYLSRNDVAVSYITGLGDDLTSDWLVDEWTNEGVDCSLVTRMIDSVPGMYMINVADDGERSFLYWRKGSPASRLFDDEDRASALFESIKSFDYLYVSGISLAILASESLARLFTMLERYREQGGALVFDGNYRPKLWADKMTAQAAYVRMYQMTDIALPTFEDEAELFGFSTAAQVMESIRDHGVTEVAVKMGGEGCLVLDHDNGDTVTTIKAELVDPVDTTAAGDSFNAAYLAARLKGSSVIDAAHAGHKLASTVIQHRGAIIPRSS